MDHYLNFVSIFTILHFLKIPDALLLPKLHLFLPLTLLHLGQSHFKQQVLVAVEVANEVVVGEDPGDREELLALMQLDELFVALIFSLLAVVGKVIVVALDLFLEVDIAFSFELPFLLLLLDDLVEEL